MATQHNTRTCACHTHPQKYLTYDCLFADAGANVGGLGINFGEAWEIEDIDEESQAEVLAAVLPADRAC